MVWLDWVIGQFITQIQHCLECRFDSGNAWHLVRSLLRLQDMDTPCVLLDSSLSLFLSFSVWSLNFELRRYIESLSSNAHICTFANVTCCVHVAYILRQEDADVKLLLLFCVWILINSQKKIQINCRKFYCGHQLFHHFQHFRRKILCRGIMRFSDLDLKSVKEFYPLTLQVQFHYYWIILADNETNERLLMWKNTVWI